MAFHSQISKEHPQQHHRQGDAVSAKTILEMIRRIITDTTYDTPLGDLSELATGGMRLSLLTQQDSTQQVATLLDPELFDTLITESYLNFRPTVMPKCLPRAMTELRNPPHPALCYGLLFSASYESFSHAAGRFFWDYIDHVIDYNPDLIVGKYSLAPTLLQPNRSNHLSELLNDGQRDNNGELMWKTFGGFGTNGLQGIIMGSRASDNLSRREDVVLKAEILAMLIQLAFVRRRNETALSKRDFPQIIVLNFADKYARVVQGTLVRPDHYSDIVELRISVCEVLPYVDENNKIDRRVWKKLLGWTFCRAAKAKQGDRGSGYDTAGSGPGENDDKLVVSKTREREMNYGYEKALRRTSKHPAASLAKKSGADDEEEESMRKASKSTVASLARGNDDMSAVEDQNGNRRSSPARPSSSSSSPSSSPSPSP